MNPYLSPENIPSLREQVEAMVDEALAKKQDKLVAGTNIKNIDGQSIVGSGNVNSTVNYASTTINPPSDLLLTGTTQDLGTIPETWINQKLFICVSLFVNAQDADGMLQVYTKNTSGKLGSSLAAFTLSNFTGNITLDQSKVSILTTYQTTQVIASFVGTGQVTVKNSGNVIKAMKAQEITSI